MRLEEYYTINKSEEFKHKISEYTKLNHEPIGIVVVPIDEQLSSVELVPEGKHEKIQASNHWIDRLVEEDIITPKL